MPTSILRMADFQSLLDVRDAIEERTSREVYNQWISNIPYAHVVKHDRVSRERAEGTGKWLLRHERYLEWRDLSISQILWLQRDREYHCVPIPG